jgi:hypothetical protein
MLWKHDGANQFETNSRKTDRLRSEKIQPYACSRPAPRLDLRNHRLPCRDCRHIFSVGRSPQRSARSRRWHDHIRGIGTRRRDRDTVRAAHASGSASDRIRLAALDGRPRQALNGHCCRLSIRNGRRSSFEHLPIDSCASVTPGRSQKVRSGKPGHDESTKSSWPASARHAPAGLEIFTPTRDARVTSGRV